MDNFDSRNLRQRMAAVLLDLELVQKELDSKPLAKRSDLLIKQKTELEAERQQLLESSRRLVNYRRSKRLPRRVLEKKTTRIGFKAS
jgi:hypothetical protein